jgi:hypothetical protein
VQLHYLRNVVKDPTISNAVRIEGSNATGILGKSLPATQATTLNAMIAITDPMDNPTNAVLKTESR